MYILFLSYPGDVKIVKKKQNIAWIKENEFFFLK